MSDEEFDDLPSISVSSVSRESSWSMPSANELATERQREQQVEDELRALRVQMAPSTITMTAAPPRSDSSGSCGSEGEAALAAAVSALRVRPTRPLPVPKDPPGFTLLQRFMPELTPMELAYMDALKGPQSELVKLTETYGLEFWGRAAEWLRVFRMQKRAVKAIVRIPYDESARPHFEALGIMTLPCLLLYQVASYTREHLDAWMKPVQGGSPGCPDDEYIGLPRISLQGSLVSLIKILNFEEADQGTLQAELMVMIGSCDHPSTWDRDTRAPILRLLCAAAVSRAGLRARRALHHVLDATPKPEIKGLVRKMEGADTSSMLTLCDSARGGGVGGELFAALLLRQLLGTLAGDSAEDNEANTAHDVATPNEISALLSRCSSTKLPTSTRHMAVQLAGRLLAVTGARHLPAGSITTTHTRPNSAAPEQLRLALAQAKLQLLFRGNEKTSQSSQ